VFTASGNDLLQDVEEQTTPNDRVVTRYQFKYREITRPQLQSVDIAVSSDILIIIASYT